MDKSQFKTEFDRNYLPLCMYALRILSIREDAEDVVQQCFAAVWERLVRGDDIQNIKAYLYMSVRNRCLSEAARKASVPSDDLETAAPVDDEDVDAAERDAKLWEAIGKLPEKCRKVFLMSKRDGMSHKEISEALEISVKTVENQMTKAFSRLREALEPKGRKVFFLPFL